METTFLVNPVAGRGKGLKVWRQLEKELRRKQVLYRVVYTEYCGAATDLARQLVNQGCSRLVVVGGDGTLQEVINGIDLDQILVGVIPGGTGNDFARSVGIPGEPSAALGVALSGREKRLDLGRIDGRYFLNIAGIGFDAQVAKEVNDSFKFLGGTKAYLAAVFKVLITYRNLPLRVEMDAQTWEGKALFVAVGNGQYVGGGMRVVPQAVLDDGLLHLCIAGDVGKLDALATLPKIFNGAHTRHPHVYQAAAKEVTVTSPVPVSVHVDGELMGTTPVTFRIVSQVLRFITDGYPL
ncbi:MAG: diacylglycerol/lipid kinase family protein [Bacillota bacterium]